jgi:SAM-dependent methyltransferase
MRLQPNQAADSKEDTPSREFTYDSKYYSSGIAGFHQVSFPIISAQFKGVQLRRPIPAILDFGCGGGYYSKFLRTEAAILDGVDSSAAIETSGERANYNSIFFEDLGAKWESAVPRYDVVFSVEVIEHVSNYRTFLANAYSSLKPGGTLFLTTTTYYPSIFVLLVVYRRRLSLRSIGDFLRGCLGDEKAKTRFLGNIWEYTTGHYHGFEPRTLQARLAESGFVDIQCGYLHIEPVVPVRYFATPYGGRYPRTVACVVPLLRLAGKAINRIAKLLNLSGSNVAAVARRPSDQPMSPSTASKL